MITKGRKKTRDFLRRYLMTVVSVGVILALFVFTVCSLGVNTSGSSIPEEEEPTVNDSVHIDYVDERESKGPSREPVTLTLVSTTTPDELSTEPESEPEVEEVTYYVELTDDEINMLATLIYLEGNTESVECQKAICSVVINRMLLWDMTVEEVIYQKNQFTPARLIQYYEPTQVQLDVVNEIITEGVSIPEYVCYFRADYYHNWSGMNEYDYFDHTYFSYSDVDYSECVKG